MCEPFRHNLDWSSHQPKKRRRKFWDYEEFRCAFSTQNQEEEDDDEWIRKAIETRFWLKRRRKKSLISWLISSFEQKSFCQCYGISIGFRLRWFVVDQKCWWQWRQSCGRRRSKTPPIPIETKNVLVICSRPARGEGDEEKETKRKEEEKNGTKRNNFSRKGWNRRRR